MIKFEHTEVIGWKPSIRGMRNPLESWGKSDSYLYNSCVHFDECNGRWEANGHSFEIGFNDLDLMKRLRNAGTDHRKFMRMLVVYVDITAPLYWWKEFDTYKVGTVANSCSTMHCIHKHEFTVEDFSHEHLMSDKDAPYITIGTDDYGTTPEGLLDGIIEMLNLCRQKYLETKDKRYWWQMIQLLPTSYNQKRTVMMSYEVLANIYKSRKDHKQDEWKEHSEPERTQDPITDGYEFAKHINARGFCDWIKTLPYSELITMPVPQKNDAEMERYKAILEGLYQRHGVTACELCDRYDEMTEEDCKKCQFYKYSKYARKD